MKLTGVGILIVVWVAGCSQKDTDKDRVLPVISISTPGNGQVFTPGQSISITGTITDDTYVAEAHIHVTNSNTGTLLMDVHLYPASGSASFNQSLTASAGVNYRVQVIAKDKAVNQATVSVDVSCN